MTTTRGLAVETAGVSARPQFPPGAARFRSEAPASRAVIHALRTRRRRNRQAFGMFVVAAVGVIVMSRLLGPSVSWYGVIGLGYLSVKLTMASVYKPVDAEVPDDASVAVVIPVFNEDPALFRRCIESLLAQTRRPEEIWVIDDGSDLDECFRLAEHLLAGVPGAVVRRFETNRGKRHAQAGAFRNTQASIICTVDSDTILDPDALREGMRPFADPTVTAVTGNVGVANDRSNLLTRLTTLRYSNAFLWERAAYSTIGSVVCCCGSLAFWRTTNVQRHLEDYVSQTFLGVDVPYGDDRRLTNYALLEGKTRFQETAIAKTVVPEHLSHYIRQQVRWNKSFFRESVWAVRNFSRMRLVWLVTAAEIVFWLVCMASLFFVHAVRPFASREWAAFALVFMVLMSFARSVRYVGSECDVPLRTQFGIFLLAPCYSILSTFVLVPLRLVSMATMTSGAWGTRGEVEVRVPHVT